MKYSSGSAGLLVAVAIVFLHVVATSVVPESEQIGEKETERIIGGRDARPGQFPYAVALFYQGRFFCTASIISPSTVLTAAQCVVLDGDQQSPDQYYGIANVSKSSENVRIDFNRIIVHPEYSSGNLNNDVAVMKTVAPVAFDENVNLTCIARSDTPVNEYKNATAMGWGDTSRISISPIIPDNLQFVEQRIVRNNACPLLRDPRVNQNKICATGRVGGGAICNGDSGGPFVHLSRDKPSIQIGIALYGNAITGCGTITPSVFTRVSNYVDFIMQAAEDSAICTV